MSWRIVRCSAGQTRCIFATDVQVHTPLAAALVHMRVGRGNVATGVQRHDHKRGRGARPLNVVYQPSHPRGRLTWKAAGIVLTIVGALMPLAA